MTKGTTGFMRASCDGASHSNPGAAGAGVHLECPYNNGVVTVAWPIGIASNAAAEYNAVILALKIALALGASKLEISTDHETLVDQLVGDKPPMAGHLRPLYQEAQSLIARYPDGVEVKWCPRASLDNERANELAGQAAGSNPPNVYAELRERRRHAYSRG